MNRKEINAMTDEELCVKAAELSGWKPPTGEFDWVPDHTMQCDPGGWCYYTISDDWTERKIPSSEFTSFYFWHTDDGQARTDGTPDYLNNIEDAWKLTNYVPGCRWSVYELDECGWAAVVMGKIEPINGHTTWDVVAESGPDTAPRAITKAFIMAMENE